MPKNSQQQETQALAAELRALSTQLNLDPPDTNNMSAQQMQEALDSLRQLSAGQQTSNQDKSMIPDITEQNDPNLVNTQSSLDNPIASPPGEQPQQKQLAPYTVASGQALIVRDGEMLKEGSPVTADMVPGGQERLDQLVEAKLIQKNDGAQQTTQEAPGANTQSAPASGTPTPAPTT